MVETIVPVVDGDEQRRRWGAIALHATGAGAAAAVTGALLGGIGAVMRAPWGQLGPLVLIALAFIYALREGLSVPVPLPQLRRQVPEWWRTFFSPPVAALLYGIGLGPGFLTYLSFGTFTAVGAAAVVSGSPLVGTVLLAPFGVARGVALAVVSSTGGTTATLERVAESRWLHRANAAVLAVVGVTTLAAV